MSVLPDTAGRGPAPRTAIVDFRLGNLFSVERACAVAGLSASVGNHDVDVRVQLVERFRIRRLAAPPPEQVPVFTRHAQSHYSPESHEAEKISV